MEDSTKRPRHNEETPLLIWVDLVDDNLDLYDLCEELNRLRSLYPLMSIIYSARPEQSKRFKQLIDKQAKVSRRIKLVWLNVLADTQSEDPLIHASAHHSEIRFWISLDKRAIQPFGSEWPLDAMQLRGAVEELLTVDGTNALLALYQDDDNAVLARTNQSDGLRWPLNTYCLEELSSL